MAIVERGQGQQLNHEIKLLKHKIWSPVVSGLCYVKKKIVFLNFHTHHRKKWLMWCIKGGSLLLRKEEKKHKKDYFRDRNCCRFVTSNKSNVASGLTSETCWYLRIMQKWNQKWNIIGHRKRILHEITT